MNKELEIAKNANLRDHQPTVALYYQGIVEEVCARKLGDHHELTWDEARTIIVQVAKIIGKQAEETSQLMNMDLATGKDLLPSP